MRLKDVDDGIAIELTVPESRALDKAMKILMKISRVPCPEQGLAGEAAETIETVLVALSPAAKVGS